VAVATTPSVTGDGGGRNRINYVIDTGDGTNSVTIGNNQEQLSVTGGSGADTITVGSNLSSKTHVAVIDGGDGNDVISIGEDSDFLSLSGGAGDDVISVGNRSSTQTTGSQYSIVSAGIGADTITIGSTGVTQINLGQDTDQDSLTFEGTFTAVSVYDWTTDDAPISFSAPPAGFWEIGTPSSPGFPSGGTSADLILTNGYNKIVVQNAAGVDLNDVVSGLNLNFAPEFIGAPSALLGNVGNRPTSVTALDLSTLFSDDRVTVAMNHSFPTAFGVLSVTGSSAADTVYYTGSITGKQANVSLGAGNDVFSAIAFAAAYSGSFNIAGDAGEDYIGFGDRAALSEGLVQATGGDDNDTILFGNFAAYSFGEILADGGAGNDTITFGTYAGDLDGTVTVLGGTGDDIITFGSNAGNDRGAITIDGGAGADTINLGLIAQNLTIDLGADTDVDRITALSAGYNWTITNWVQGIDIITINEASFELWHAVDVAGDKVFNTLNNTGNLQQRAHIYWQRNLGQWRSRVRRNGLQPRPDRPVFGCEHRCWRRHHADHPDHPARWDDILKWPARGHKYCWLGR